MATLYTHKDANIRKTWFLMFMFFVVVIALGWFISYVYDNQAILYFAVIFSIFMNVFSYWFSDKIVLSMYRAIPVTNESHPDLYNIVENLSITAGLPMPKVYVIPDRAPNAFATGRNKDHSAVAVTQGLLEILDRTELEGVIAHELSHIGNRDMLVSTIAVVLVGFISILGDIFIRTLAWGRHGGGSSRREGASGAAALIGFGVALLAPLGAVLIQLAISRQREYLADATGVLLTRYPDGLASALEKISADTTPMRAARTSTAHLWIAN